MTSFLVLVLGPDCGVRSLRNPNPFGIWCAEYAILGQSRCETAADGVAVGKSMPSSKKSSVMKCCPWRPW